MDVGSFNSKQKSAHVDAYANENIGTNRRNENLTKIFQSYFCGNDVVV